MTKIKKKEIVDENPGFDLQLWGDGGGSVKIWRPLSQQM
jgi:hypothetical protein